MSKKRNELGIFIRTGKYNQCMVCNNNFYVKNCHADRKFCSRECYWKSVIGSKQSESTINKRIKSRENYKHSEETKEKIGAAHRGNKNWSWRGGISKLRNRQFSQVKHKNWREKVFKRDNYTCQKCKARSGNGKAVKLEAHHIKPFAYFKDLRYNMSNGLTLCKNCHIEETRKERKINWSNQYIKKEPDLSIYK